MNLYSLQFYAFLELAGAVQFVHGFFRPSIHEGVFIFKLFILHRPLLASGIRALTSRKQPTPFVFKSSVVNTRDGRSYDGFKLLRVPLFKSKDELLLAHIDVIVETLKGTLKRLELGKVVPILSLQVLHVLQHHQLFFVDNLFALVVVFVEF